MSPITNLRKPLVYMVIYSLVLSGLLTFTIRQSHASRNSSSSPPSSSAKESFEKTMPPAEAIDEATRSRVTEAIGKLPLSFEENRGQVDGEVKYVSRGSGYTLFLTATEAVLTLRKADKVGRQKKQGRELFNPPSTIRNPQSARPPSAGRPAAVLRMKLAGASPSPAITGESEMGVRTNYFIGNDPEKWHTDVARYERVRYAQVYPGVDMIYYGQQQQLEYDFEVAPGADAGQIALEFAGVKRVKVERQTGDLVLQTAGGEVRQRKPGAYQEVGGVRREVESRYVVQGKRKVGIEVGEYDPTQRLVIDPALSYSTYLGGSSYDYGTGIAVDSSGIAYVTGYTYSSNFPTKNQYQTFQGYIDAFVTKIDMNASGAASLLYSIYLGGNSSDYGPDIAIDASGIVYVTGITFSTDFPTKNQYQTFQGASDAFVTKIDTNLSGAASLLYSTCLGGSSNEYGLDIAIDASGNAYVTGYTHTSNFPTKNQYQTYQGSCLCDEDRHERIGRGLAPL
jgi:hypothetical protein